MEMNKIRYITKQKERVVIMKKEDFDRIVFGEQVEYKKQAKDFKKDEGVLSYLLEFDRPPFEMLIDKLNVRLSNEPTANHKDKIYMRYADTDDTWDIGYTSMDLALWKYLEDIFYNYKPKIYQVEKDKLVKKVKGDFLGGVKFVKGDLDAFIE